MFAAIAGVLAARNYFAEASLIDFALNGGVGFQTSNPLGMQNQTNSAVGFQAGALAINYAAQDSVGFQSSFVIQDYVGSATGFTTAPDAVIDFAANSNIFVAVPSPAPIVSFTATVMGQQTLSGFAPLTVQFTDTSVNATSWAWDFQNDGTTDSTIQNPLFTYTQAGTYSVKLTASNESGSNSLTKVGFVTVQVAQVFPVASFTATGSGMTRPLEFFGEDLNISAVDYPPSTAKSSAAEGSFLSHLANPRIEDFEPIAAGPYGFFQSTFPSPAGNIVASFFATNPPFTPPSVVDMRNLNGVGFGAFGRYSMPKGTAKYFEGPAEGFSIITSRPIRAFGFYGVDIGDQGGRLQITLRKSDGTIIRSIIPNTTVGFIVQNAGFATTDGSVMYYGIIVPESEAFSRIDFAPVQLPNGVTSDIFAFDRFTIADTTLLGPSIIGHAPLTVQFTDTSTDTTTREWDFQNNASIDSTSQNPSFVYTTPGLYSVKLIASNTTASNTLTKTNFVRVLQGSTISTLQVFQGETVSPAQTSSGGSLGARNAFLSAVSGSVLADEPFTRFSRTLQAPFYMLGGIGRIALGGTAGSARIETDVNLGAGRFNTTGAGTTATAGGWWQSNRTYTITFEAPVNAFGTYLTDQSDFDATLTATLTSTTGATTVLPITFTVNNTNGGLAFWGFVHNAGAYTSITFTITQPAVPEGQFDIIGFDDMVARRVTPSYIQQKFFGENLSPAQTTTGAPVAQRAAFISSLSSPTIYENNFSGEQLGAIPAGGYPLTFSGTNPGGLSIQLTGTGTVENAPSSGRFDTSGGAGQYLTVAQGSKVSLVPSVPVRALGFYVTDASDVAGQLLVKVNFSDGTFETLAVPHTVNTGAQADGTLAFFGFKSTNNIQSVDIIGTANGVENNTDRFGIDDLVWSITA